MKNYNYLLTVTVATGDTSSRQDQYWTKSLRAARRLTVRLFKSADHVVCELKGVHKFTAIHRLNEWEFSN